MQNAGDHCWYIKQVYDKLFIILVWVDDLIIATSNEVLMCDVKQMLKDTFHMKDRGQLLYFLGTDDEPEKVLNQSS